MTCPNCYSDKSQFLFNAENTHGSEKLTDEKFEILKCVNCGLIFPKLNNKNGYYKKYYPSNYYHQRNKVFMFAQDVYKFFYQFWLKYFLNRFSKRGKILDFGCGEGQFLASMPKSFTKYGLEINLRAVSFIKKNYPQIRIFDKMSYLKSNSLKFNLITMWHSLEHLDNPKETLLQLTGLLEKDGYLILSTPNSGSFGFKIAQSSWFHLDAPRHLAIFNSGNLTKLCQEVGLKVIKIESNWLDFPLDFFWSLFNKYKSKYSSLNFLMTLFILPSSLTIKFLSSFWPENSETINLVCKKR